MKKLLLVFIAISTLVCQKVSAKVKIVAPESRTTSVVGEIDDLQKQADKVLALASQSNEPIYVYLDTPGGSVAGGLLLVRAINRVTSRGVPVVCLVDGMSMSMGMHIMAACSHNYALPTSLLMYHEVALYAKFVKLTERSSEAIRKQLELIGGYLDKVLRARLGVSEKVFKEFHHNEYVQYAHDFKKHAPKFLKIVDDIQFK